MSDKISVLIGEKEVDERIEEIGKQISKAYEGKCVHIFCIRMSFPINDII